MQPPQLPDDSSDDLLTTCLFASILRNLDWAWDSGAYAGPRRCLSDQTVPSPSFWLRLSLFFLLSLLLSLSLFSLFFLSL